LLGYGNRLWRAALILITQRADFRMQQK